MTRKNSLKLKPSFKADIVSKKRDRFEIRVGDSAKLLKDIPDISVDLVVTSPPYDGLRDYNGYSFDFETIAKELTRVLRPGGVIVWVVGDATVDGSETGTSFRQALYFKDICGLRIHDTMIYQKCGISFPESARYYQNFEYMFIFSKGAPEVIDLIKDKVNTSVGQRATSNTSRTVSGKIIKEDTGLKVGETGVRFNVWKLQNHARGIWSDHPATFPYDLAADHIKTWSRENMLVLDPFCGSGTTGEAAYDLKRRFIGIEISEEYAKLSERRILGLRKIKNA